MVDITINHKKLSVPEGHTILQAAKENGFIIPTLCHLENIHKCGSCRICSVEVKGSDKLVAACIATVAPDMEIFTNTKKVAKARKMLYNLILSDHSKNCLSCSRNQSCELQKLGQQLGVFETVFTSDSVRHKIDKSTALSRDLSKCILCRRCITMCSQVQGVHVLSVQHRGFDSVVGPQMDMPLELSNCTNCGQCTTVCPVGALKSVDPIKDVWDAINDPERRVIVQCAPSVHISIAEMFGNPPGTVQTGKLAASVRAMGADDVFNTNWGADLTVMEEGTEFISRMTAHLRGEMSVLPMITSCSPGWVKFTENFFPAFTDNLSTCKSPHMMVGAIAKSYYAQKIGVQPEDVYVVSVMPCTAKKYEITREEMRYKGLYNVDAVLTTRELSYMIVEAGVDFNAIADEEFDEPMGISTGAAELFGTTGGVMEAALRTMYGVITGRSQGSINFISARGCSKIKEATVTFKDVLPKYREFEGVSVNVAVTSGLLGARKLMERVGAGAAYHFVEVMGCPGGCVMGGGQPRSDDPMVREKRMGALRTRDENSDVREAHKNPSIQKLYEEFLGEPGGEVARKILHTRYVKRGIIGDALSVSEADIVAPHVLGATPDKQMSSGEGNESVRLRALERENDKLKEELRELKESAAIFKRITS